MTRQVLRFGLCAWACVALTTSLGGCREEQTTVEELLPTVAAVAIEAVDFDQEIRASGESRGRATRR